jgi:hypothetical protein
MTNERRIIAALTSSLLLLLGGCDRGPTAPAESHGLLLGVYVGLPTIGLAGADPVFTTELLNVSDEEITVVFPTTCTVRGYIDDARGNTVYPSYGTYGCGDAITRVTLAPGQVISRAVVLRTEATPSLPTNTVVLPPGRYRAYAEIEASLRDLGGQRVMLQARPMWFRLQ